MKTNVYYEIPGCPEAKIECNTFAEAQAEAELLAKEFPNAVISLGWDELPNGAACGWGDE